MGWAANLTDWQGVSSSQQESRVLYQHQTRMPGSSKISWLAQGVSSLREGRVRLEQGSSRDDEKEGQAGGEQDAYKLMCKAVHFETDL